MAKAKKPMKKAAKKVAVKKTAPKKKAPAKKAAPKAAAKGKTKAQLPSNVISLHGRAPKVKRNWTGVISPLDDRVLLEMEKDSEKMTPGGLIIPDTVEISGNFKAKVVAVGRGHRDKKGRVRPLELQVGDRVLIQEWSGNEIEIDGEKLRLVRESEVLGTLE